MILYYLLNVYHIYHIFLASSSYLSASSAIEAPSSSPTIVFNNSILNALKDGNHFAYINIDSAIITRRSSMVNERISSLVIKFLSNFDIGRFNFEQRKVMAKDLRGGRCEDGEHEEPQWIQLGCHKRIEPRGAGIGIALSKGKFNITCSDGGFILRVGNF